MRDATNRMVRASTKFDRLFPFGDLVPQIDEVVKFGKTIAPYLLSIIQDDPDKAGDNLIVQQLAELALCTIYMPADLPNCYFKNVYNLRRIRGEIWSIKELLGK